MPDFRVRDPIHGLIQLSGDEHVDQLCIRLIDSPEFQRLRRIKQLGVSEYVFPGATHSRLSHSIGVYHNARRLAKLIRKKTSGEPDEYRESVSLVAALLHDIGHGPFSHAFEEARKEIDREQNRLFHKHEKFSSDLISSEVSSISGIIQSSSLAKSFSSRDMAEDVSALLRADEPKDIYHSIVSGSFDADRLDYIVRDRYMCGTLAGGIDPDWLLANLEVRTVSDDADGEIASQYETLVFTSKARQAAEDFLLARHRLFSQVYLHKKTRGTEQLIKAILIAVGRSAEDPSSLGLDEHNPLVRFFHPNGGGKLADYKLLDDGFLWGMFRIIASGKGKESRDQQAAKLCQMLLDRSPIHCLDLSAKFDAPTDVNSARFALEKKFAENLNYTVFLDDVPLSAYGINPAPYKRVRVFEAGVAKEVDTLQNAIFTESLVGKKNIVRFYFLELRDKMDAEKAISP